MWPTFAADHAMWPTFAADHALTSAIVDVTRGLRADLTRSAFHLKNAAASGFQQGSQVEPRSSVPRMARQGQLKDAAEAASKQ
jgi:hypothetical protein